MKYVVSSILVLAGIYSFYRMSGEQKSIQADKLIIYPKHQGQSARSIIVGAISQASKSIQMSAYQMKDEATGKALIMAARRGVKIDLILEETPFKHDFNRDASQQKILPLLQGETNITLHKRPQFLKRKYPKGHYHARYIIIDQQTFLLTTGNFDRSTFEYCRDFAIVFTHDINPEAFKFLQNLFKNDIMDNPQSVSSPYGVIVGPEGQKEKILRFIESARKSIKLYQQYFNDKDVLEKLITLIQKGISVEMIMGPFPTNYNVDPNAEAQDQLQRAGADVRLILDLYAHGRAIIVDDKRALVGTAQLSPPSLKENREVSIIVEGSVVDELIQQFMEDKKSSVSLEQGRRKALERKVDWNELVLQKG